MTTYGYNKYGPPTLYGKQPAVTVVPGGTPLTLISSAYLVEPFTAVPYNYTSALVTWTGPDTSTATPMTEFRLLSSRYGFPVDENDGTVLIDSPNPPGQQYLDTNVVPGEMTYYAFYIYGQDTAGTPMWIRSGFTAVLMPVNHGYSGKLWAYLPSFMKDWKDYELTSDPAGNPYLLQYLEVCAWGLDYLKTQYDFLFRYQNDPMGVSFADLGRLAGEIGMPFYPEIPSSAVRKGAQNWAVVMRERGTLQGLADHIDLLSGYGSDIQVSPNLFLEDDQSLPASPAFAFWSGGIPYAAGEYVTYPDYPQWVPTQPYTANNYVYYNGTAYQCTAPVTGTPPAGAAESADYWAVAQGPTLYQAAAAVTALPGTAPPGAEPPGDLPASNSSWTLAYDQDAPQQYTAIAGLAGGLSTWEVLWGASPSAAVPAGSLVEGLGVPSPSNPYDFAANSIRVYNKGTSAQDIWLRSVSRGTVPGAAPWDACAVTLKASSATGPVSVVQHASASTGYAAGTTGNAVVTLPLATTAGNCLVACVSCSNGSTVNPVVSAVTSGGTGGVAENWAAAVTVNDTSNHVYATIWADPDTGGGQTQVGVSITLGQTDSLTAETSLLIDIYEVSGVAASAPADKTAASSAGNSSTTWSSGTTATTSQASEIAFGIVASVPAPGVSVTLSGPASWVNEATLAKAFTSGAGAYTAYQQSGYAVLPAAQAVTYTGSVAGSPGGTASGEYPDPELVVEHAVPVPLPGPEWSPAVRYTPGETVTYDGFNFLALRASTGAVPQIATATPEWAPLGNGPSVPLMISAQATQNMTQETAAQYAITPFCEWYDSWGNIITRVFARAITGYAFDSFTAVPGSSLAGRTTSAGELAWTAGEGSWTLDGAGNIYPAGGNPATAVVSAPLSCTQALTFAGDPVSGQQTGLVFWYQSASAYWLAAMNGLWYYDGTWTQAASYPADFAPGDRVYVVTNQAAPEITVYRNVMAAYSTATASGQVAQVTSVPAAVLPSATAAVSSGIASVPV